MEDNKIIELYFARQESAIKETDVKYGSYCRSIAMRILCNKEDSEECVNDTWMSAWISIPPKNPEKLSAYLGRITRNLSLKKYEKQKAKKRGSGEIPLAIAELSLCIPDDNNVEDTFDEIRLTEIINSFLTSLAEDHRKIFMQRYWYFCSIKEIAQENKISQSNVKMTLLRLRNRLRESLKKEGIEV